MHSCTINDCYNALYLPLNYTRAFGDGFTHGRMIGKLEEGHSLTSVAEEFGINKSIILRAWKVYQTVGTTVRKVGGGLPKERTAMDGLYIVLKAKRA
ncbi:uncharacterized protein TNCV_4187281 [Trichonephila clavipes]|nr:uncharacterized protein TNCV_4187281 [Trichonephila clavipes]